MYFDWCIQSLNTSPLSTLGPMPWLHHSTASLCLFGEPGGFLLHSVLTVFGNDHIYCGWCVNSVSINTPHSYKAHFTAIYWSSFDAFIYQKNITSNKSMFTCFWTSLPCSTSARLSSKLVVSLGIGSRSLLLLWYYVYSRAIDICIYYVNFVYSEEPLDCWVRTKRRLKVITSVLFMYMFFVIFDFDYFCRV